MTRTRTLVALPLLVALGTSGLAGCRIPEKYLARILPRPTPTPTPTPVPAPEAKAELLHVNDERVKGEGDTSRAGITVGFPGTKGSDVASARVVLKKAVDDLGTNLVPDKAAEAAFEPVSGGEPESPVVLSFELKNAPRTAKLLKEVTAEVELYTPNLDPAALVTIPSFLGEAGKPLVQPALKAAGVDVAIQSPAQIEQEKKAFGEKSRAGAKKVGLDAAMVERTVEIALDGFFTPDPGDVVLKISDPGGRIQEFVFLDPAGGVNRVNRGSRGGFVVLSSQGETPGPDWSLQLRLKTPKSFRRFAFTLRDVALP